MVSLGQSTMRVPWWLLLFLAAALPLEGRPLLTRNHGGVLPERFRRDRGLHYLFHRYPSLHSELAEYIPVEMQPVLDAHTRRQMITAALKHFHLIVFNKTRVKPQEDRFPYPPHGAYIQTSNDENTVKPVDVNSVGYQGFSSSPSILHTLKPTADTTVPVPIHYTTFHSETTLGPIDDNLNTISVDDDTEPSTTTKSITEEAVIQSTNETDESHFYENQDFLNIMSGLINESTTPIYFPSTSDEFHSTTSIETTTSLNGSDFITSNEFINIISDYIHEFTTEEPEHSTTPTTESYDDNGVSASGQLQELVTSNGFIKTVSQILNEAALKETTEYPTEDYSDESLETVSQILNETTLNETTEYPTVDYSDESLETTPNTLGITEDGSELVTSVEFIYAVSEYMNENIPETTQHEDKNLQGEDETTLKASEAENTGAAISELIHILEENLNESRNITSAPETQIEIGLQSENDQYNTALKEEDNETESDDFPVISLPDEDLMLISNLFPVLHVDDAEVAGVVSEYVPSGVNEFEIVPSVYEDYPEESKQNVSESKLDHEVSVSENQSLLQPTGEDSFEGVGDEKEINSVKPTDAIISFDTTTPVNGEYHLYLNSTENRDDKSKVTEVLETSSTESDAEYETSIKTDTPTSMIEVDTETVEEITTEDQLLEEILNIFDDQQENVTNAADVITGNYNEYIHTNDTKEDNYIVTVTTEGEEDFNTQTTDVMTENNLVSIGETHTDVPSKTYSTETTTETKEIHRNTEDIIKDGGIGHQAADFSGLTPEFTTYIIETTETTDFPTTVRYGSLTADKYDIKNDEDIVIDDTYDLVTAISYIEETTFNQNELLNVGSQTSDVPDETTEIVYNTLSTTVEESSASKTAKRFDVIVEGQVLSETGKLNVTSNNIIGLNTTDNIQDNVSDTNLQTNTYLSKETSMEEKRNNSETTTVRTETSGKWSLEYINETEPISDTKKLNSYPNISRFIDNFFKGFEEISSGMSTSSEDPGNAAKKVNSNETLEAKTEESNETNEALSTSQQSSNRNGKHYTFLKSTESYSTPLSSKDIDSLSDYHTTSVIQGMETTTELTYTTNSIPINTDGETGLPEEDLATTIYPFDEQEKDGHFEEMQHVRIGEMLMLIPALIQELQNGTMTDEEQTIFHEMYGTLWPAIVAEAELNKSNDTRRNTTQVDQTIALPSQGRYKREAPSNLFMDIDSQDLQNMENRRRKGKLNSNRSNRMLYGSSSDLNTDWEDVVELDLQEALAERSTIFKSLSKEAWDMLSRSRRSAVKVNPKFTAKEDGENLAVFNLVAVPPLTSSPDERSRQ